MITLRLVLVSVLLLASACQSAPPALPPAPPPDGPGTAAPAGGDGRAELAALVARRDDPNYFVSDERIASAIDALRGVDPTLVANARGLLAEKATASKAIDRAKSDDASAPPERKLDTMLALKDAEAEYARLDARLTTALHALRDAP